MNQKKKMLITGVSGLLGSNLAYALRHVYEIQGWYHAHAVVVDNVQMYKVDILSEASVRNAIKDSRPEVVIHCAAIASPDFCEDNPDLATRVNIAGTKMIVDHLKDSNAKFVYISTDTVYDGVKGNFSEDDPVNPLSHYGRTKYQGEREALKRDNTLVARTNFFGWNIRDKFNLAEWILDALFHKKEIRGFMDVCFSSIYTFELAKLLDKAVVKDLRGVYNFASSDSLNKYQFACLLAERFGREVSLIKPISVDEHPFKARRSKNLSLNTKELAKGLNCLIPSIKESVELFYKDYNRGILHDMNSANLLAKKVR